MRNLEDIQAKMASLNIEMNKLMTEIDKMSKISFKNIIFNPSREINKKLYELADLQGQLKALVWILD